MTATAKKYKEEEKPSWAKKDVRDFSDADVERLFDQWEVGSFLCLSSICLPFHETDQSGVILHFSLCY